MAASAQDLSVSDSSEGFEQQTDTGSQIDSSAATGMSHPEIAAPNMQYVTTPHIGAGNTMVPTPYPYPDLYYRGIFTPYDTQPYPVPTMASLSPVQLQLMGIQQAAIPLPSDAIEEPVFVNAKQYHGILRRRQSRAKAESENKILKSRKPYLHESRHLHALKRARGSGGRFLNSKKSENHEEEEVESGSKSLVTMNLDFGKSEIPSSECTS